MSQPFEADQGLGQGEAHSSGEAQLIHGFFAQLLDANCNVSDTGKGDTDTSPNTAPIKGGRHSLSSQHIVA